MKFIKIKTKKDIQKFSSFIYNIYKGNSAFKDIQVHLVKQFLYKKDLFTQQALIEPIIITENDTTLVQAMFIYHPDFPALQIAFFEAIENVPKAVNFLLSKAKIRGKELNLSKITIGLNGHVSYGVGLLDNKFNSPISFDSLYGQPYYNDYFTSLKYHELYSYQLVINDVTISQNIKERFNRRFSFRLMNMKFFKREIELFGELCNNTLADTPWYFPREPLAMYQLMSSMKFLLKAENLIFVLHKGVEIGFVFWHPDYSDIHPSGRAVNIIEMGIRQILFSKKINSIKINCIGIKKEFRSSSIYGAMLAEVKKYSVGRYEFAESNFVWGANRASIKPILHLGGKEFRRYRVYEEIYD